MYNGYGLKFICATLTGIFKYLEVISYHTGISVSSLVPGVARAETITYLIIHLVKGATENFDNRVTTDE